MKSPLYMSAFFYENAIKYKHGDAFKKRMALISRLLKGKEVVELGCGTGHNSDFLQCTYRGFDMNKKFIKYGKKKCRNIEVGNAFDVPLAEYNAILIVDVLHHVKKHRELLKKALATGKEIVVCEPFDQQFSNALYGRLMTKVIQWIDSDGINPPVPWYRKNELKKFYKQLGKCKLFEIGEDVIAHYPNKHRS